MNVNDKSTTTTTTTEDERTFPYFLVEENEHLSHPPRRQYSHTTTTRSRSSSVTTSSDIDTDERHHQQQQQHDHQQHYWFPQHSQEVYDDSDNDCDIDQDGRRLLSQQSPQHSNFQSISTTTTATTTTTTIMPPMVLAQQQQQLSTTGTTPSSLSSQHLHKQNDEMLYYQNQHHHSDKNYNNDSNHNNTDTTTSIIPRSADTISSSSSNTNTNNNHRNYTNNNNNNILTRQSSELTHIASNRSHYHNTGGTMQQYHHPIQHKFSYDNNNSKKNNNNNIKDSVTTNSRTDVATDSTTTIVTDIQRNHKNYHQHQPMQPPPPRLPQQQQQQGEKYDPLIPQIVDNNISHTITTNLNDNSYSNNILISQQEQQQQQEQQKHCEYFRIVFQGVVAILSLSPPPPPQQQLSNQDVNYSTSSVRTGQYVSYGEIVYGSMIMNQQQQQQPIVIIHSILTGGYAVDTTEIIDTDQSHHNVGNGNMNDRHFDVQNASYASSTTVTSPEYKRSRNVSVGAKLNGNIEECDGILSSSSTTSVPIGYIYVQQNGIQIVESLLCTKIPPNVIQNELEQQLLLLPQVERGIFHYRVTSTSPIPILTGPNHLAPKTNSMLLPGTVHEISVRVQFPSSILSSALNIQERKDASTTPVVTYLRLRYRRGWIADRKLVSSGTTIAVLQEIFITTHDGTESHYTNSSGGGSITTNGSLTSATMSSLLSTAASSSIISIATSKSQHKHRLPRKRQDAVTTVSTLSKLSNLSRHNGQNIDKTLTFPRHIVDGKLMKHGVTTANDPSSNMSILSEDSSVHTENNHSNHVVGPFKLNQQQRAQSAPTSPNTSCSTTTNGTNHNHHSQNSTNTNNNKAQQQSKYIVEAQNYYLMRVLAPRGMKILDAPQYQVNRLIRNTNKKQQQSTPSEQSYASFQYNSQVEPITRTHNSIFHTMTSRLTTTTGKSSSPLDSSNRYSIDNTNSKSRILPFGSLFESSKRMETTGSYYNQGAGLIKLSDNSGWAIVPRQAELDQQYPSYKVVHKSGGGMMPPNLSNDDGTAKAYEEVGSAVVDVSTDNDGQVLSSASQRKSMWVQVTARTGVQVFCYPPLIPDIADDITSTSPTSSRESSAISNPNNNIVHPSSDSDVTSSVGSAFLDALFRTPQKSKQGVVKQPAISSGTAQRHNDKVMRNPNNNINVIITCGTFLEIERFDEVPPTVGSRDFARLHGGQGWIPLFVKDKSTTCPLPTPPIFRYGSFWFRVRSIRGIKVRFGPYNRASSIKSEEGEYFRFECGEFLRASEIITKCNECGEPTESFAKLYRNRHVQLQTSDNCRTLQSLAIQAEWVQIHNETELFLEECAAEPRMERHKQGWRYNVIPDEGIALRKGPSFAAEKTGVLLFGGETVVVNERVTPTGEAMAWLRLKDGQGWIHDFDENGKQIVISHSLRHRVISSRSSQKQPGDDKVVYNAIISRLFHNEDRLRSPER